MVRQIDYTLRSGETFYLDTGSIVDKTGATVANLDGWAANLNIATFPGVPPILSPMAVAFLPPASPTGGTTPPSFRFSASTEGVPPGSYVYDVRLESPAGDVYFPIAGKVVILAPVTTG